MIAQTTGIQRWNVHNRKDQMPHRKIFSATLRPVGIVSRNKTGRRCVGPEAESSGLNGLEFPGHHHFQSSIVHETPRKLFHPSDFDLLPPVSDRQRAG
jgi:hypothetical protein